MTDPTLKSFVPVPTDSHFSIQNLPFGVFRTADTAPRVGVAIGDHVLDLAVLERRGLLNAGTTESVFDRSSLNRFMSLGRPTWIAVRERLTQLLDENEPILRDDDEVRAEVLLPRENVELLLPVEIGDYTDFYSSKYHATNVGTMMRGSDNALQENWTHLPVAYHGRASSVVVGGMDVVRPSGPTGPGKFGPSRAFDFELEVGFLIGPGSRLGEPIPIDQARDHIFGMVLVNDWSARDIQRWEYVPLGPFLAKNFATSISPWVVMLEALEPFQIPIPKQEPEPLPYLRWNGDHSFDIRLEVELVPAGGPARRVTLSNFRHLYWTMAQQLAHHTVSGCDVRTGDLMASGTVSGPDKESRGCLLELTWRGEEPIEFEDGQRRTFLHDGDRVTMTAWCQGAGYRIGFGEVTGVVRPSQWVSGYV